MTEILARPEADSTFLRAARMLRDMPPGERLEAIAYAVAVHQELAERDLGPVGLGGSLDQLLAAVRDRVRELQAGARP